MVSLLRINNSNPTFTIINDTYIGHGVIHVRSSNYTKNGSYTTAYANMVSIYSNRIEFMSSDKKFGVVLLILLPDNLYVIKLSV